MAARMTMRPPLLLASGLALALLSLPAGLAHEPAGTPKPYCESTDAERAVHEYTLSAAGIIVYLFDGAIEDCGGGPASILFDGDGHWEHALGGAQVYFWGGTVGDGGSWWCHGVLPDHVGMSTVTVVDESGEPVPFLVGAEQSFIHDFCGDGEDDVYQECLGSCAITLGSSMDGAYRVYVLGGTKGHVVTT